MKKVLALVWSLLLAAVGTGILSFTCYVNECTVFSGQLNSSPENRMELRIQQPQPYDRVTSPIGIELESRISGTLLNYRIEDDNNRLLAAGYIRVAPSYLGEWHAAEQSISLEQAPTAPQGMLEIFAKSDIDGSVTERVLVPLRFGTR